MVTKKKKLGLALSGLIVKLAIGSGFKPMTLSLNLNKKSSTPFGVLFLLIPIVLNRKPNPAHSPHNARPFDSL